MYRKHALRVLPDCFRFAFAFIEPLLRTVVYIRSDRSITTKSDATPTYINAKLWQKYFSNTAECKERLGVLQTEKREVPSEEDAVQKSSVFRRS